MLQDVWLGQPLRARNLSQAELGHRDSSSSVQWMRLPDSPIQGRAHINYRFTPLCARYSVGCGTTVPELLFLTLVGGQIGHRCGLHQLAVCSQYVYRLVIRLNASSPTLGLRFDWLGGHSTGVPARCNSGGLMAHHAGVFEAYSPWSFLMAMLGGQLSYNDTTCRAPIVTVNDAIYSQDVTHTVWYRKDSAPFSPRLPTLYDLDADTSKTGPRRFLVSGGVRYLNHTVDPRTGLARLLEAEMYADVWQCWLGRGSQPFCSWTLANISTDDPARGSITQSLPVPLVDRGAVVYKTLQMDLEQFTFARAFTRVPGVGGRSSRQALLDWQHAVPWLNRNDSVALSEMRANATMITQPLYPYRLGPDGFPTDRPTLADVERSRYGLPFLYRLHEAELNDPTAPFNAGCDCSIAELPVSNVYSQFEAVTATTLVRAASQQVQLPQQSTLFLYQAAPAFNTSRALFDFPTARHSQGTAATDLGLIVSGGESAGVTSSDWMLYPIVTCAHPEDPSFFGVLGNGTADLPLDDSLYSGFGTRRWSCRPGSHLEPPPGSGAQHVTIRCMGPGVWMSTELNTIASCVKDALLCPAPLVDLEDRRCGMPAPIMTRIALLDAGNSSCRVLDPLTLIDCPLSEAEDDTAAAHLLRIDGAYFTTPLLAFVGGVECADVELYSEHAHDVCDGRGQCFHYGSVLLCTLQPRLGYQLPVQLLSGAQRQLSDGPVPTVSFRAPSVIKLSSPSCSSAAPTVLRGCPHDTSFNITVWGANLWLPGFIAVLPQTMLGFLQPLPDCTMLSDTPAVWDLCHLGEQCEVYSCAVDPSTRLPLDSPIPVLVKQPGAQDNLAFDAAEPVATLSLTGCPAGSVDVAGDADVNVTSRTRCRPCPAGQSTSGLANQVSQCVRCPLGSFANISGSAACELCPANTFANITGLVDCLRCPVNSYEALPGQSECHVCDLNQYLVPVGESSAKCHECLSPLEAQCLSDGSIVSASAASFLLVDQAAATVSSAVCYSGRCLPGEQCLDYEHGAVRIELTGLRVINCCSAHRLPASENPLCGQCEDGYSEWNGACALCDWSHVSVGLVVGAVLLAVMAVWALHRLPNDRHSGTVGILLYFTQTTLLFCSNQQLSQLLGVVNFDPFSDGRGRGAASDDQSGHCFLPLSPLGKLLLRGSTPFFAALLLGLLWLVQLAVVCCLHRCSRSHRLQDCRYGAAAGLKLVFGNSDEDEAEALTHRHEVEDGELLLAQYEPAAERLSSVNLTSSLLSFPDAPAPVPASTGRLDMTHARSRYERSLVRLVLYGYSNIAAVTQSYFNCESAGAFGWFLAEYPAVSCESEEYRQGMPLILVLLVAFVIVPPVVLAIVLCCQRKRVQRRLEEAQTGSASPWEQQPVRAWGDGCLAVLADRLVFVYAVYRAECSWYALVILLRRLLLISVFVFGPVQSVFSWLSLVNGLVLLLHARLWPFLRSRDNWLECATLTALFVQTTVLSVAPLPWSWSDSNAAQRLGIFLFAFLLVVLPTTAVLVSGVGDTVWNRWCFNSQWWRERQHPLHDQVERDSTQETASRFSGAGQQGQRGGADK